MFVTLTDAAPRREATMATDGSLLFSWADVERLPDLERLGFVLEQLPDEGIVSALEAKRGRGRCEYPVRAMWRALVSGVVFGHASSASLLRELGRNPALLDACGFDPLGRQSPPRRTLLRNADGGVAVREEARPHRDGIPTAWAFSRFLSNVVALEEESGAVSGMVDALRGRLRPRFAVAFFRQSVRMVFRRRESDHEANFFCSSGSRIVKFVGDCGWRRGSHRRGCRRCEEHQGQPAGSH